MHEAAPTEEPSSGDALDPIVRLSGASDVDPVRRLAAAVVLQALDDLALDRRAPTTRIAASRAVHHRGVAWRAAAWFASDARDWPFAFTSLCEALELDPQRIRRLLGIEPRRDGHAHWTPPPATGVPVRPAAPGRARRGALRVVLRDR